MKAGAGKAEVALAEVLPFDGFDEVRHPIHARAVVVEASARCCIVSLEVTSLAPALVAELRSVASEESGAEGPYVWVCVSHCFSAPHVRTPEHLASDEERARNLRLKDAYVEAVRTAVRMAAEKLCPAELAVAKGPFSVNVNRDVETPTGWWLGSNPQGFSDHSIRALKLTGEDGAPLAVLCSADIQSSVLDRSKTSEGKKVVSGDLAGFAAGKIERQLGGVVLFAVGAAGDQAPQEQAVSYVVNADGMVGTTDAHEEAYRMLHKQGAVFARELAEALAGAKPVACENIAAESHELVCPGQERADFHTLAPKKSYEYHPAALMKTQVHLLRLGSVVIAGVEPEIPSSLGAELRVKAAGPYFDIVTMVNGGAKYLPAADAYEKITYEAMNSGFAQGSADILKCDVLAACVQMLQ